MNTELQGSAVTICHLDNTFTTVVTAERPSEVRHRLNTLLEPERPPFVLFEAVDTEQTMLINCEQVQYIQIVPQTLADFTTYVAPTREVKA